MRPQALNWWVGGHLGTRHLVLASSLAGLFVEDLRAARRAAARPEDDDREKRHARNDDGAACPRDGTKFLRVPQSHEREGDGKETGAAKLCT